MRRYILAILVLLCSVAIDAQSIYTRITHQNLLVDPSVYPPKLEEFKFWKDQQASIAGAYTDTNGTTWYSTSYYLNNLKTGTSYNHAHYDSSQQLSRDYLNYYTTNYLINFGDTVVNIVNHSSGIPFSSNWPNDIFLKSGLITFYDSEGIALQHLHLKPSIGRLAIYKLNPHKYNIITEDSSGYLYSYLLTNRKLTLRDSTKLTKVKGLVYHTAASVYDYPLKFSSSGKLLGSISIYKSRPTGIKDSFFFSIIQIDQESGKFGNLIVNMDLKRIKVIVDGKVRDGVPYDFEFSPNDSLFYFSMFGGYVRENEKGLRFFNFIRQYKLYSTNEYYQTEVLSGGCRTYLGQFALGSYPSFIAPNGRIYLRRNKGADEPISIYNPDTVAVIYDEIQNPNVFGPACNFKKDMARYEYLYTEGDSLFYTFYFDFSQNFNPIHPLSFTHQAVCKDSMLRLIAKGEDYSHFTWQINGQTLQGDTVYYRLNSSGKLFVRLQGHLYNQTVIEAGDTLLIYPYYLNPQASYVTQVQEGCQYIAYEFRNTGKSNAYFAGYPKQYWDFGDGTDTTLIFGVKWLSHTYKQDGDYQVRMIADNGYCKDTFTQTQKIRILPAPRPGIQLVDIEPYCAKHPLRVSRQYTDPYDSAIYRLDNQRARETVQESPVSLVHLKGKETIYQQVYGPTGCITSDSISIETHAGLDGTEVPYLGLLTVREDDLLEMKWYPSDAEFSTLVYYSPVYQETPLSPGQSEYTLPFVRGTQGSREVYIRERDLCDGVSDTSIHLKSIYLEGKQKSNEQTDLSWSRYRSGQNEFKLYDVSEPLSLSGMIYTPMFSDEREVESGTYQRCFVVKETSIDSLVSASNRVCFEMSPIVYIPTAFSPNGDGHNEYYEIYMLGMKKVRVEIYSVWGELLFRSEDTDFKWDGRYKGELCPGGNYLLRLSGFDGKDYHYHKEMILIKR